MLLAESLADENQINENILKLLKAGF